MPLYEVALIEEPTPNELKEGKIETLILPPTPVVARDEQAAGAVAVMKNKDHISVDLNRIKVLVRLFA